MKGRLWRLMCQNIADLTNYRKQYREAAKMGRQINMYQIKEQE